LNRLNHGALELEGADGVEKRLSGKVLIDVLDVQVGDDPRTVPERPLDLCGTDQQLL
jgi:hypothetical protein